MRLQTTGVSGAGGMGAGIAQACALAAIFDRKWTFLKTVLLRMSEA